jgi:hypothetical protein
VDTRRSIAMRRICFDLVIMVVNASEMYECYANIFFFFFVDNVSFRLDIINWTGSPPICSTSQSFPHARIVDTSGAPEFTLTFVGFMLEKNQNDMYHFP